jgi:uncharacterized protein YjiS (DUF1127 family)
MARPITAPGSAIARPIEAAHPHPSRRAVGQAARPDTELEKLLRRWVGAGLPRGLGLVCLWVRRLRLRHELAHVSEAQLRDVGLDPDQVRREREKPFWMA